jgi:hypothetical protein
MKKTPKKRPPKKVTVKKAAAKKPPVKKAPAKKPAMKRGPAKKAPAKVPPVKKMPAKKPVAKKRVPKPVGLRGPREESADFFSCAFCHTYEEKPFAVCRACGHIQPPPPRN